MGLEHSNEILRWLNVEVHYMLLKNNALNDTLQVNGQTPSNLPRFLPTDFRD